MYCTCMSASVYTLQCAVLLCLVCVFDLACFFLSSFSSLIKTCMCTMYMRSYRCILYCALSCSPCISGPCSGGGFTSKRGIFGKVGKSGTMLSLAFSAEGDHCFSGGADGKIYHWTDNSLTAVVEAHKGPVFAMQRVEKVGVAGGCGL